MLKKPPVKLPSLSKIPGLLDDFQNRNEFVVSDISFSRAVDRVSLKNTVRRTDAEVEILHGYEEQLEKTKKRLVSRIMELAQANMVGIQLQAFMLSFEFGVNKSVMARSMNVSRQSIQIRNKRAIRRLKRLIFTDKASVAIMAEMQWLRKRIVELDSAC